tara:strand:+ start:1706 stop:2287 length:582 start_codon:yes stop_codon:yes gene_type:complete
MRDIKSEIKSLKHVINEQDEKIADYKIALQKLEYELKLKNMTFRERAIFIIDEKIKLWQESGIDENYFFDDESSWDDVNIEIDDIIHNLKDRNIKTYNFNDLKNHLKNYVIVNGWRMGVDINTDNWYWANMNYKITIWATPNMYNELEIEAYDDKDQEHGNKTYSLDLNNNFEILLDDYITKLKKAMVSFKVI